MFTINESFIVHKGHVMCLKRPIAVPFKSSEKAKLWACRCHSTSTFR